MKLLSVILMILLASPAWAFPPLIAGKTATAAACVAGYIYCNGTDGVFEASESCSKGYPPVCMITIPAGCTSVTSLAINVNSQLTATTAWIGIYAGSAGGALLNHCDVTPNNGVDACSITQAVTPGANYYISFAADQNLNIVSDENSGNNASYMTDTWDGNPPDPLGSLTTWTGKIPDLRAYVE